MLLLINKRNLRIFSLAIVSLVLLTIFFIVYNVEAATLNLSVNSLQDNSDNNVGDGLCDDGTGFCTLRAAIEESESTVDPSTISFNPFLWAGGPATIVLNGTLVFSVGYIGIDGPGHPSIDGNLGDIVIDGNDLFNIQLNTGVKDLSISGLEITNQPNSCINIDGTNISLYSNSFHDCEKEAINSASIQTVENIWIGSNLMEDFCQSGPESCEAVDFYGDTDFIDIDFSNNTIVSPANVNSITINPWENGSVENLIISGNTISGGTSGIEYSDDINSLTIFDNIITTPDICISGDSNDANIYNNQLTTEESEAVAFRASFNASFVNNTVVCQSEEEDATCVGTNAHELIVTGNTISGGYNQIYIYGSLGQIQVTHNILNSADNNAFGLEASEVTDIIFDNNTINNTTSNGFQCWDCDFNGGSISNNTFTNIGAEGVSGNSGIGFYRGTQENLTIEGNVFTDSYIGIWFNGGEEAGDKELNNSIITDNTISGSSTAIWLNEEQGGSNNDIYDNTINNTTSIGIEINSEYLDDLEIANNNIDSSGTIGININKSGDGLLFNGNTISNSALHGIRLEGNANPATFSNDMLEDNGTSEVPLYNANLFSVSYNDEEYDATADGDGYYYYSRAFTLVSNSDTEVLEANGSNNFDLALLDADGVGNMAMFIRDDFVLGRNQSAIETWCNTWAPSGCTADGYFLNAMTANGTISDYSWTLSSEPGLSTSNTPELEYIRKGYAFSGYYVENSGNIFTNETLTGNGRGFTFTQGDNEVIDSIIDSLGFDIIQDNGVVAEDINVMNNTDFETYNIDQGIVEVHYKVRVKVVDGEGSNASGVIVNALGIDGEEYGLGITDISGLSNYATLEDVYILDKGGVDSTTNDYVFTAVIDGVTAVVTETIDSANQQVEISLGDDFAFTKYDITGNVKKDEEGIANVELHIYDSQDNLLSILQTNSEGFYQYSNLDQGVYEVVLQPASLPNLTGFSLLESNPRLVTLSGADVKVNFNYSSTPVVNENINGNSNTPYVNYNYNTNTNSNANSNTNYNENSNSNINTNRNSNENNNINQQISIVNANINLNTNSNGEDPVIEQKVNQDLVLEGTAEPNTKIIITIELESGETISVETITDSQGNWQVTFDKDKLPAGDHTIYIQTELNGQLSEMVELAKLVITGDKKISTTWLVAVTIFVLFIIIIIILILLYAKKRNKKDQT